MPYWVFMDLSLRGMKMWLWKANCAGRGKWQSVVADFKLLYCGIEWKKQARQCTCNVILRCLRETIVAVDEQNLLKYWVCVFVSFVIRHTIRLRCTVILWPAGLYDIFPHYLTNGTSSKKKVIDDKICAFFILCDFAWNKHFSFEEELSEIW